MWVTLNGQTLDAVGVITAAFPSASSLEVR